MILIHILGGGGGAGHQNSASTQEKAKGQNGGGIVYIHIKGTVTYMSGGIDISGDGGLAFTETVDGGGGGKIL